MMKFIKIRPQIMAVLFTALVFTSCYKDPASEDEGEFLEVNEWIQENMELYYFWNSRVPDQADGDQTPEIFFDSMLEPGDQFSYMSDDAEELVDDLNGSSFTAGYSPAFYKRSQTSIDVFILVEYVYPDSPADEGGLKRGDLIYKINGQQITTNNYLDLYYDESEASLTLGELDVETMNISEKKTITVAKAELELDPVVFTNVYEMENARIGYIFYSRFLNGEGDVFIESIDNALANFHSQGITELVVDLRYNRGGRITAAQNMANTIAPTSVTSSSEVFVRYQYNDEFQKAIEDEEGPDSESLFVRFSEDPVNLELDRVFFLTTSSSASASELLINGLDPHMEVVTIGTNTFGKFYGSFVITGDRATPPNNYAIVPVVLKYANSLGVTDFVNGLEPHHEVQDQLLYAKAIGDTTDALLAKAFELITGEPAPSAKYPIALPYEQLENPVEFKKGNILFIPGKTLKLN